MQMLKKLFNSDNKYYLELDEIKDSEIVQSAVKTAEKAADVVKEKTAEVAQSKPIKEAVKTASEAAEVAQDKLVSAIATDEKPADSKSKSAKTKKTSVKSKSRQNAKAKASAKFPQDGQAVKESSTDSDEQQPQSNQKNSGASSFDPPFWVAAMYNNNSSGVDNNGQAAEQTFATDNLMPIANKYRRRPGGSLSKFKDMAKEARKPKRG